MDRLLHVGNGRRLRRVATSERFADRTLQMFVWRIGIVNYALLLFGIPAALLAVYSLTDSRVMAAGFLGVLTLWVVFSTVLGIVNGAVSMDHNGKKSGMGRILSRAPHVNR